MRAGIQFRVAVVDPLPLFREGIVTAISSDELIVEAPADIRSWVAADDPQIIILTLSTTADWSLLANLVDLSATLLIVVLLESVTISDSIVAIRAGACSVMGRDITLDGIRRVLAAVVAGDALLPSAILKELATQLRPASANNGLVSSEQLAWLGELASGKTVAQLANNSGYSERAMFRLLRSLYSAVGAKTRTEALMIAQEKGWIGPAHGPS